MKTLRYQMVIGFVALALTWACSSNPAPTADQSDVKITRTVNKAASEPGCQAKIVVDGMSCSQMCTGAIKKSLASLDGVKNTAVYFDPERKNQDYATLEFDQQSVTEKELIAAIEKLNDGQYKVKSVEIVINEVSFEKIDDKADKKEIKTTGKISAIPAIRIAVPSIMALLGRMLK